MNKIFSEILKQNNIKFPKENNSIYPLYKKGKSSGRIVKFDGPTTGDVVYPIKDIYVSRTGWISHDVSRCWADLTDSEYVLIGVKNE